MKVQRTVMIIKPTIITAIIITILSWPPSALFFSCFGGGGGGGGRSFGGGPCEKSFSVKDNLESLSPVLTSRN